ncbi:Protein yae1 [Frankliniella fusca]|uniref:Protein yae1 n=1 Tax=Frankliniella fusca TaxID=407009 RepID=A0AAE1I4N9_9NEOP|nr:Protein yae1 [Frankliniella fusca]
MPAYHCAAVQWIGTNAPSRNSKYSKKDEIKRLTCPGTGDLAAHTCGRWTLPLPSSNPGLRPDVTFPNMRAVDTLIRRWPMLTEQVICGVMDSKLEELKAYIDSKYANLSKSICESSGIINDNNNQNLVRDIEILKIQSYRVY